ncbi:transcription initiation factor TFIID subunit [Reticulomyxa filosa]|uniref:Transcription initiation factor TFIID subunit n=1 Tax=Reticulomyxa filosa TaxID=46433 RepID=X6PFW0_RETFI|nr:transcription initiation factor TFIID subunit [Reticulomyxa filosa]|eukprot:ETO36899.1 transcription initiation factor TFIID subunit [Reticulomyxa filosa]
MNTGQIDGQLISSAYLQDPTIESDNNSHFLLSSLSGVSERNKSSFKSLSQPSSPAPPIIFPPSTTTITTTKALVHTNQRLVPKPSNQIKRPSALPAMQSCFDQLWKMRSCHEPLEKGCCLLKLKEMIVNCIDRYRLTKEQERNNDTDDDDDDDDDDDNDNNGDKGKNKNRNGNDDDDDDDDDNEDEEHDQTNVGNGNAAKLSFDLHSANLRKLTQDDNEDLYRSVVSIISDDNVETTVRHAPPIIDQPKKKKKKTKSAKPKMKEMLMYDKTKDIYVYVHNFVGADDMIPFFAYCLVKSQLPSVFAEIAFVDAFLDEESEQTEMGSSLSLVKFFFIFTFVFFSFQILTT